MRWGLRNTTPTSLAIRQWRRWCIMSTLGRGDVLQALQLIAASCVAYGQCWAVAKLNFGERRHPLLLSSSVAAEVYFSVISSSDH